jgi:hypothetical protein
MQAYIFIHDGVHHGRFGTGRLGQVGWVKKVADAHAHHHKQVMGPPFGLFLGPEELVASAKGDAPPPPSTMLLVVLTGCVCVCITGLAAGF